MGFLRVQIISTLTFAAACASAGITVLIDNDLDKCFVNHCARFQTATAMAYISCFAMILSFLLNLFKKRYLFSAKVVYNSNEIPFFAV